MNGQYAEVMQSSPAFLLFPIDIQGRDATMTISKEQVIQRAIEMSNKKPRVQISREVLEHIDPTKTVRVYRNLHKGCLSVKQGGIVKCHADNVVLRDFQCIVSQKGQENVRRLGRKEVHAYLEGFVVPASDTFVQDRNRLFDFRFTEIYYNPYKTDFWMEKETGKFVDRGEFVDISADSVLAFNYLYRTAMGA